LTAESYRHLRTSVLLSTAGRARGAAGDSVCRARKTTTAVNTALSLAQTGASVCIIDADMPAALRAIFGCRRIRSQLILSSEMSEAEMLALAQSMMKARGLNIPISGRSLKPAELLGSEQMRG
jgi:Mrp family chromosome partitioning ATPase